MEIPEEVEQPYAAAAAAEVPYRPMIPRMPDLPPREEAGCFAGLRAKALRLKSASSGASSSHQLPVAVEEQWPLAEAVEEALGIGSLVKTLDAVRTQQEVIKLLLAREGDGYAHLRGAYVILLGFTYDREDITKSLIAARRAGSTVKVLLDSSQTLKGATRDQLSTAKELVSAGIAVRVAQGYGCKAEYAAVGRKGDFAGIMHAKSVLVGNYLVHGSCNWTTSSRGNAEFGTLIRLTDAGVVETRNALLAHYEHGTDLTEAQISAAQRSRSASPAGRGQSRSRG
jgi:hypothetical protein